MYIHTCFVDRVCAGNTAAIPDSRSYLESREQYYALESSVWF
jgi:hypothetical protein